MLINDFYKINKLQVSDNFIDAQIKINDGHNIFKGHFPDKPIVPGVMQQQIVKEILSEALNKELQTVKISNMKFMALIEPDKNAELSINIKITSNNSNEIKIDAKIFSEQTIFFKIKAQYL